MLIKKMSGFLLEKSILKQNKPAHVLEFLGSLIPN